MKTWNIPVVWQVSGCVSIEADTLDEALSKARDSGSLPVGQFVEDSFDVAVDDPDHIRKFYNGGQADEVV